MALTISYLTSQGVLRPRVGSTFATHSEALWDALERFRVHAYARELCELVRTQEVR